MRRAPPRPRFVGQRDAIAADFEGFKAADDILEELGVDISQAA